MKAGFWRRLAAAWVDLFVIYAMASFLVTLTSMTRARIALEPMCMLVGAAYGAALLTWRGQTIGKMLARIADTANAGGTLGLRHALLREVVGKWGIGVAGPLALGRVLIREAWVPTVYDVLILLPVLLLQLAHYLIAKRAWYDRLAGTSVERAAGAHARPKIAFAALMGAAVLVVGTQAVELAARGRVPCRLALFQSTRSTAPYVSFLTQEQHPARRRPVLAPSTMSSVSSTATTWS